MKRTFIFLLSIFLTLSSLAQIPYQYIGVNNNRVIARGQFKADSALILPGVSVVNYKAPGMLRYDASDSSVYVYSGFNWIKVGPGAGGSSYTFTYPLQLNTSTVSLDTTKWHSFPFYNTQYRPITWVPTLQEVTTAGKVTIDTVSVGGLNLFDRSNNSYWTFTANEENLEIYNSYNNGLKHIISFPIPSPRQWSLPDKSGTFILDSDTSSMLSPYLRSNVAAATYQPIGSYLITSDTTGKFIGSGWLTTLAAKQNAITLTTTGSSGAATFSSNTLNIPNYTLSGLGGQPQLNGTGFVKASGTTITYDNTTYLARSDTSTLSARIDANYATITALGSTGFTLNRPNGTKDTILFTGTSAGVQWTGSDTLFSYNRVKNGRHFNADLDWIETSGQVRGSGDAMMLFVTQSNTGTFTSFNSSGVNGVTLSTASSASADTRLFYGTSSVYRNLSWVGSDPCVFNFRVRIPTAFDGTDRGALQVGVADGIGGNVANGYYFSYDPYQAQTGSPATSNWATVTANGSTRTWTTTSTAISAGSWVVLTIRVTSSKVIFYIDGTAVAEHSTNITTTATAPLVRIFKNLGTGARTLDIDYITFDQWYSTPR